MLKVRHILQGDSTTFLFLMSNHLVSEGCHLPRSSHWNNKVCVALSVRGLVGTALERYSLSQPVILMGLHPWIVLGAVAVLGSNSCVAESTKWKYRRPTAGPSLKVKLEIPKVAASARRVIEEAKASL